MPPRANPPWFWFAVVLLAHWRIRRRYRARGPATVLLRAEAAYRRALEAEWWS